MEQFFILIAIAVFWIFKQAASGSRRRLPGEDPYESGPLTKGGLDATIEEANRRAMEALKRWEAKQTGAGAEAQTVSAPRTSPTRREPLPETPHERAPRVSLARRSAERERKKAYSDIAAMLGPAPGARFSRQGSSAVESEARARRRTKRLGREVASELTVQPPPEQKAEQAAPQSDEPAPYRLDSAGRPPRRARGPEAALSRLERLPVAARAIVYAEILGRPKAHD